MPKDCPCPLCVGGFPVTTKAFLSLTKSVFTSKSLYGFTLIKDRAKDKLIKDQAVPEDLLQPSPVAAPATCSNTSCGRVLDRYTKVVNGMCGDCAATKA